MLDYCLGRTYSTVKHFLPFLVSAIAATIGAVINFAGFNWFCKREKVDNPVLLICHVLIYV